MRNLRPSSQPDQTPNSRISRNKVLGAIGLATIMGIIGGKVSGVTDKPSEKIAISAVPENPKDIHIPKENKGEMDIPDATQNNLIIPRKLPKLGPLPEKTPDQILIEKGKTELEQKAITYLLQENREIIEEVQKTCKKVVDGNYNHDDFYKPYEPMKVLDLGWEITHRLLEKYPDDDYNNNSVTVRNILSTLCGTDDLRRDILKAIKDDARMTLKNRNLSRYEKMQQLMRIMNVASTTKPEDKDLKTVAGEMVTAEELKEEGLQLDPTGFIVFDGAREGDKREEEECLKKHKAIQRK